MKKSFYRIIILCLVLAFQTIQGAVDPQAQDKGTDTETYQKAYNLVLDEDWNNALKALDSFMKQYQSSRWLDDARFWRCYVQEKMDKLPENAYECYSQFIKE